MEKGKNVELDEVYNFTLRVAYLSHLTRPKPSQSQQQSQQQPFIPGHKSTGSRHLASSIATFSITDLLKDSKSVKFPEKFVKVLEKKCEQVAMGRDPHYNDRDFRALVGIYYGKFDKYKSTYKSNRKVEEIVMHFVSESSTYLKKISPETYQTLIMKHSSTFMRLIIDSLRNISGVSSELLDRMKGYEAKLDSSDNYIPKTSSPAVNSTPNPNSSNSVSDMPMVLTVGEVFNKSIGTLQEDINVISLIVSEKAAFNDIKMCLQHLGSDQAITGSRQDFSTDSSYEHWRLIELETLTQLMKMMVQLNPSLAKSSQSDIITPSPRPTSEQSSKDDDYFSAQSPISRKASFTSRFSLNSTADVVSRTTSNEEDQQKRNKPDSDNYEYTIIPYKPKEFYSRLLHVCMAFDLDVMQTMSEDDEVSLGILSPSHLELLTECAVRWRISVPHKTVVFVNEMVERYENDEIPVDCLHEVIRIVQKAFNDWQIDKWPANDRSQLVSLYKRVAYTSLIRIGEKLDDAHSSSADEIFPDTVLLPILHDTGLLNEGGLDIKHELDRICQRVQSFAVNSIEIESNTIASRQYPSIVDPAFAIVDWVQKTGKKLDKLYPMPILDYIDVVPLFIEKAVPLCITDINKKIPTYIFQLRNNVDGFPIDDAFELMSRVKRLLLFYRQACPDILLEFSLSKSFGPFVDHYLEQSARKTEQWVQNAIRADSFELDEQEVGHSSSIVDLFSSLKTSVINIKNLDWPDEAEHAKYITRQAKTLSRAIDQYSRTLLEMFMAEMFPQPLPETPLQGQSAWVARAQNFVQGEKKLQPFLFDAKSCVKINNIEAAKSLLDNLYSLCNADEVASLLQENESIQTEKIQRYLFSIKIVMAEDLSPRDLTPGRLDPFVTIANERGDRIYKSRTIYNNRNPRWEESVDVSITKTLWIGATIWDRSTIGEHKLIGRGYLKLDPPKYEDCLPQDKWLKLDTNNGSILLRVSMEGEKDDIQFHFGRANISLKRAEADMTRTIVDKMSPFIHQCLNRTVLRSLRKGGGYSEQVTKTIDNLTANYKKWKINKDSSDSEIPLPKDELPPPPPTMVLRNRNDDLTDQEIEHAIEPLFDYFDANFSTLASTLTDSAKTMVMTRVWKEVLATIEGLLVPPLSKYISDMRPLPDKEVDIVFKWLQSLRLFFHADGNGLSLETLQNQKYNEILSIRLYYDWPTDPLMEECVKMMQMSLRKAPTLRKKMKTVKAHRNMGTMKDRKKEKKRAAQEESEHGDIILKILRMRPSTRDFIESQLEMKKSIETTKTKSSSLKRSSMRSSMTSLTLSSKANSSLNTSYNTSVERGKNNEQF